MMRRMRALSGDREVDVDVDVDVDAARLGLGWMGGVCDHRGLDLRRKCAFRS